ncbi:hypothetical protein D1007_39981 [Hordeum vulgare]|nr:hypothetical protein D1007_39981 [Hordeum vulgare]
MDLVAAASDEWQFTTIVKVDTHMRKTDLSVVYTNDPIIVENSIKKLEQLLAEDDKYKMGLGSEKKKQKDSLIGLVTAIIDPYYRDMKAECDKEKSVSHKAWVNELMKNTSKIVYPQYTQLVRLNRLGYYWSSYTD